MIKQKSEVDKEMVSKNNVQVKDRQTTQQVPHYGIRKLSVGVASVLLGTTFYMGINGNVAHADTVNGQEHETPDSQVANNNSNSTTDHGAANAMLGDKQAVGSATGTAVTNEVNAKPQVTEITNGSQVQSDAANGVKSDANTPVNTAANTNTTTQSDAVNTNANAQSQNDQNHANTTQTMRVTRVASQIGNVSSNALSASLAESTKPVTAWQQEPTTNYSADHTAKIDMTNQPTTVQGDNWQMSLDKNYIKAGQGATLTVNYQAQSGDTFVLDIGYPSGVNAQPLNSQVGTTSTKDNGLRTQVTNVFKQAGTYTQVIKLNGWKNSAEGLESLRRAFGDQAFDLTLKRGTSVENAQDVGRLYLTSNFTPTMSGTGSVGVDRVDAKYVSVLSTNNNYIFTVRTNWSDYGTALDPSYNGDFVYSISVPKTFELDQDATEAFYQQIHNSEGGIIWRLRGSNVTVSQAGVGSPVIIKAPALDWVGWHYVDNNGVSFLGHFVDAPNIATTVTAEGQTTVSDTIGGHTQTITLPGLSAKVINAADYNYADSEATEFSLSDYGDHNQLYQSHEVPMTGDGNSVSLINDLAIVNNSPFDVKNATVTLTFGDGLHVDVDSVRNNAYLSHLLAGTSINREKSLLVIYQDGTSETVPANSKGDPTKNIKSITLTRDWNASQMAGMGWQGIRGFVANTYQDGSPVKVGDTINVSLTVAGVDTNGHNVSKTVHDTLKVVDQQFAPLATRNYYGGVDKSGLGDDPSGTINIHWYRTSGERGKIQLENPTLYFVMPNTVSQVKNPRWGSGKDAQGNTAPTLTSITYEKSKDGENTVAIMHFSGALIDQAPNNYVPLDFDTVNKDNVVNQKSEGYLYWTADNVNADGLTKIDPTHLDSQNKVAHLPADLTQEQLNKIYLHNMVWGSINMATGMYSTSATKTATTPWQTQTIVDYHGDGQADVGVNLVNDTSNELHNVVAIINLPKASNNSNLTVNLTGNKVELIDPNTNSKLTDGVTILYSTKPADLSSNDLSSFVTADQVADWSKVQAVAVTLQKLGGMTSRQVQIPVVVNDLVANAGKAGTVGTRISADELRPIIVSADAENAAKLVVGGQATINVQMHYQDAQGKDHYVPLTDLIHSYDILQHHVLNLSDFTPSTTDLAQVPGYELSKVSPTIVRGNAVIGQPVSAQDDGSVLQFELVPSAQKVLINYVDDDDDQKVIKTDTLTGKTGETQKINVVTPDNYVLVNPATNPSAYTFLASDNKPITIHLKHATHSISDSRTVTETVHYQSADGSQVPSDHVTTVNFSRTGTHDEVTGADHWNAWNVASHNFDAVPTPAKTGYTPDIQTVPAETVTPGSNNIRKVVTYTPDAQKLNVKFFDDTTGQVLKTVTKTGVTNAGVGYNTQSDIHSYVGQHYVLVSDSSHGANLVFDNNDSVDQAYEVHLKHGTHPINEHHTIIQTVNYTATDHTDVPDDHTVSVQFDRDGYHDEVTGTDHWNNWKQGGTQTFTEVPTPKKAGYTPDKSSVPATVVHPSDHNQTINVTYTPDTQKVIVTFIDDTDSGKTLKTVTKTGPTNTSAGYTTGDDINTYKGQHYVLVSDQTHGQSVTFDTNTNADQRYEVHLKHGTHQINDHRTVTETVHYKMTDGATAPADHTVKVDFSRDGFNDEVTGVDHWNAWTPSATHQFDAVHSPAVKGYTPDADQIAAVTVNPDSKNIDHTVTYSPDAQKLDVKFIDDTIGETLKTVVKNGVTHADAGYNTQADIQHYVGQHYVLVSDSSKGAALVFDNDDAVDQHYEVHLKHNTHAISEHHTVNETVHYTAADGSNVPADHTANVQFDRDGFNDEVTGADHWNAWRQGNTQTFAEVPTPAKKGYTPDIQLVAAITVNPTDQDIKRTVTYTPDAQKLDVVFIDDTTGETLKTVVKKGVTHTDAKYNTKSDIQNYESQHYVLVSDSSQGAALVFDNDDAVDQHYVVHLKHNTHAISEHHTVNETVHYQMSDGTKAPADYQAQALSFSRDGFNDEVTGVDHWNAWTPNAEQTFAKVASPLVAGYTPDSDQINAQTVKPTDHDLEFTVTYTPNVQIAHVKYIDDTDHKVLTQDDLNGRTGETSGYHTADRITEFKRQHYVFVSDNYPAEGMTFDNHDRIDQAYEVHFKHGTRTDEQDVQVPRMIKYVYQDGRPAQPDHSDALSFHETKVVDLVDGHTVSDDWTPVQDFKTIETPAIQGYTPDHANISNTGIAHDHSAIVETVTYNPDAQKAVVKYIDDTTGKQLEAKDLTGVSDQSTGYNTKETIDGYVNKHYVLVSDGTHGETVVFDHDDDTDQAYEVHLKHGTEPANESRIKKITVHYQYADGLARSGKAADDKTATNLTFKRTGTHDLVTDKIAWNAWDHSDQTFSAIDSPAIQGYTPDRTVVDNIKVNPDSRDLIDVTVTYNADSQKLRVDFIDDTTGKTLKTVDKTGYSDESVGYNTKADIQTFVGQHYDLVSDTTKGVDLVFDHDDNTDQHYEVHLSHHTHQINEQHTVTETVHYVYADGLARSGKAADDFNAKALKFSRDGFNDEVTGVDHWNAWTPSAQQTFVAVQSPVIDGYTPDQSEINAINVVPTSQSIEKTVTYTADAQKLSVDFIDDTTGKTLKTVTKTGYSDESADYNTKADVQDLISKHYDLTSDQTNGENLVFDHNDNADQHYEVHLSHHTHQINEQHTVTETVYYRYADGLARTGKAADDFNANALKFSRDGFNDEVTGVDHWNAWTPADQQSFAAVQSPVIEGYTPDQSEISVINVVPTSQSIEKTVTYTADAQKLTVNFIDDVTGQTLKTVAKTGYSDESVGYNTKADLQGYLAKHYDLVSDATKGADLVFDHSDGVDQVYDVHLTHHLTPISDHQVVNETIHYVYADGLARTGKAADDYVATPFEFNRTGKHDDVTGTDAWDAWTPADHQTFAAVQSPAIQGYTPDQAQIDAASVNANSQDIVKTVTYSADPQTVTVDFIDDTDHGKVLKTVTKTGGSDEAAGYSTKADIQTFVDGHYKLDRDTSNGANLVFDHDDAVDQHYEVHLTHETAPISEATSTNQVIHYQLADGTPVVNDYTAKVDFSRDGFKDLVTNADHWNAWTPNATQTFDAVKSPAKAGYTPDHAQVDAVTVEPHHANLETTVTYSPDAQKAAVKYIDDTTGKTLQTKELTGVSDETSTHTTGSTIKQYVGQYYKLVSDQTNGKPVVFDHNDGSDQTFEVHLIHTYQQVSQEHQVHETIHYRYVDGKQARPDYTAKAIAFSRTGTQDLVTENIQWNAWTPDQVFAAVNTPAVNGYTPDIQTVAPVKVGHDSHDVEQTVVYHADDQTILVNYIDDETHSTLKTDSIIGKTAQTSDYTTKKSLDKYKGQHYDVVSDDTNGKTLTFDSDSTKVQTYNVHLKHQHQAANDKATVRQTVHYVYQDGKQAAKDHVAAPIEFTRTGDTDLVTGKTTWNAWTPATRTFTAVVSPSIEGYTPSRVMIEHVTVHPGDKDLDTTVTYVPDRQVIVVNYIDQTTGKTLKTDTLNGRSDQTSGYTTKSQIDSYVGQRYKLISDDTHGRTLTFDHNDQATQTYDVVLGHETEAAHRTHEVHETVDYVYADGSQAAKSFTAQPLVFSQTGVHDLVTNTTDWNGDWTKSQEFAAVESPKLTGFTASKPEVKAVKVNHESSDVHELVIYAANAQTAQIKYIDDVTGETLETDGANGHFNESIVFSHNVNDQINKFKQAHYKIVSNNFAGQKYQADNDKNVYEVHLTHERQNVHATDAVTETVKFQYADGSQAQPTKTQTVNFGRDGIKDLVTGTTAWMPVDPQTIGAVNVPVLDGYTADTDEIPAVKVNFGDNDIEKVVTYTANDQTAGIKIIDDTTGKVLNTQSATGKFGTEIQFKQNPDQQVIDLQAQHYELVSDNFEHQAYKSDNAQNQFEIHVRHQTADTQRTDAVTETVHYRDNRGNQLRPDTQATKTFTQSGVIDKVTGDIVWTPVASQTLDEVTAPEITGHTPDRNSVPAVTVNFGDNDIDQTIVYTPVQEPASIKYVDDTTGKTLLTDHTTGDFGTQINFDHDPIAQIGQYESQGYKLVSNSYGTHAHQFSATASDNNFEVHLTHGTKDAVRTSTVNRVINYVDSVTGEKLRPSTTQTLTFTEHGTTDEVTGETIWTDSPVQHFAKIATPEIEGYTTEVQTVDSVAASFGDADLEVNVPYTKVAVPETPTTPGTPEQPGTPKTPSTLEQPEVPSQPGAPQLPEQPEVPSQPGTPQLPEQPAVPTARQANHAQPAANNTTTATELPQTGDDSQRGATLAGLGLIGMMGALFGFKKKREPKN